MKALVIRETLQGVYTKSVEDISLEMLQPHEVLIRVHYAGLNYKDSLSASGHKGITRQFPHIPGVDACGTVVSDSSGKFKPDDAVICTSYDLGMNTPGGFAEYIKVPAAWVLKLPPSLTLEESMILGTAAYTAALALVKMERCGQHPGMGPVVVSGATGGVGSMAISILHKAGYDSIAISGKADHYTWLKSIGATHCISRDEAIDKTGKPLLKSKWAGGIDNVGGSMLESMVKSCAKEGCVASIGLVESPSLNLTVYPFILNGVNLLGVDSAETAMELRQTVWKKLALEWKPNHLHDMKTIVALEQIPGYMNEILNGKTRGRVVAKLL